MQQLDPIAVIEASYRLRASEDDWMAGILDVVRPAWDDGFGIGMYEVRLDEDFRPSLGKLVSRSEEPEIFANVISNMNREMGELEVDSVYRADFVHATASERAAPFLADFREDELFQKYGHPKGIYDFLGVQIRDPSGTLVIMGALQGDVRKTTEAAKHRWARLAAHIAAGYRLRHATPGAGMDGDDVEAVLSRDGKVEHIEVTTDPDEVRESLERGARDRARARGKLRDDAPEDAIELWKALIDGRYSLVDHVDTDGRQFLLARRNDPRAVAPEFLSPRERQVVQYAAAGHSNQLIAYELGLSASTVSTFLQRGLDKLNLDSRLDLVRMWGATHRGE